MSSSINMKKRSLNMNFVKKTAGYISGAAGEYISEVMPVTVPTLVEAKSMVSQVSSTLTNSTQNVTSAVKKLKNQNLFKNIYRWYMDQENDFSDNIDTDFNFDDPDMDASELAETQIGEFEKSSNKVAKAVIESSKQQVESQIIGIGNLQSTIDKQTAVISAGFDKTNDTLNKILEVVTKNTASIIEATVATGNGSDDNPAANMLKNGKFNINSYKKIVSSNIKNSYEYSMISMLPILLGQAKTITPQDMIKGLMSFGINKASPNFKTNMKALDDAVSDTIMHSIIRLGDSNGFSLGARLGKMLGIDSTRENQSTQRSTLELKSVSFDTITRESITNAIPGYLRKILVAVGGEDVVYDYKARSFKSHGAVKKEFMKNAANKGSIYSATSKVQNAIGRDEASSMFYEMFLTQLGTENDMNHVLEGFADPDKIEEYMKKVTKGVKLSAKDRKSLRSFNAAMTSLTGSNNGIMDVTMQAKKNNIKRNARVSGLVDELNAYNMDVSDVIDSVDNDIVAIAETYGKKVTRKSSASVAPVNPKAMNGITYTNAALYQIFRRLDEGINVFQVGKNNSQPDPFEKFGNEQLAPPKNYKPKGVKSSSRSKSNSNSLKIISGSNTDTGPNLLQNQENEDGTIEELTTGQRVGRWAKHRGGELRRAIFSGSPEEVRNAFGAIITDVGDVASDQIKEGMNKINNQFGNVSGYLKHKIFGTEYSYQAGVDKNNKPIMKNVAANEKGGIFGFISDNIKESFKSGTDAVGKWMNSVKGYFDYEDKSKDPNDKKVASKRKKLIFGSVGAFAGAGLLGGPIGMLVGALAGNALSTFGMGDKIKNALFGHDEETGKPTGLINKAADAILTPIQFQIGKTVSLIGASLKKNIFGPLADIGLAVKDRIANHVDTIFDEAKKLVGGFFAKTFGKLFKLIGTGAAKVATGVGNFLNTTVPGKAARGAINVVGGFIGGSQNMAANKIAKNTYHKLKANEEYTIHAGEKYLVERKENGEDVREVRTADKDMTINGRTAKRLGIKVSTRDYLKRRRDSRKEEFKNDLKGSGYYSEGGIKGFFGGDYKAFREEKWKRRKAKRGELSEYLSEREMTPEEVAAREAAKEAADAAKETAEHTATIAESSKSTNEILEAERTGGVNCFKTHDQALHDRIDRIIDLIGGKGKISTSISNQSQGDSFTGSTVTAAANMAGSGDVYEGEESQLVSDIIDESSDDRPNKMTISQKLKQLMKIQTKKSEEAESEKEKDGGILESISSIAKNLPAIAGIGLLLYGLFNNGGFKDLLDRFGTSVDNIKEIFNNNSDKDSVTLGMNTVTALADVQANKSWDWANPFANLYHNKTDAAGNQITNKYMTDAKNTVILDNPLRQDIISKNWNTLKADNYLNKAIKFEEMANAQSAKGGFFNKVKSKYNQYRSDKALANAEAAEAKANGTKTSAASSLVKTAAKVGGINILSNMTGNIAGWGASKLGLSEETANAVDNVTTAATSGALTVNMVKSNLKGKQSFIDKIIDGVSTFLKKFAEKIGAEGAVKKVGKSKVVTAITGSISRITGALKSKIDDVIISKIEAKLAGVGVKNAAAVASAGIAIAVGAVAGFASGFCGTEHLFGVLPGDADAGMKTISSLFGTVMGALEMTPAGWVIAIFDVIDAILVAIPGIECGIKQFLARLVYKAFGGAENLEEKQAAFANEKSYYEDKYGVSMNNATFSDMVNNKGFLDRMWSGKAKKGEDGHLQYDDAGKVIKSGGMKGWFVGGHNEYAKDANGEIIRDEKGNAVKKIDANGHVVKKDMKLGDHVGNFFGDVGSWFAGKKHYKLDENGEVMYDENGKPIVESKDKNVLFRTGDGIVKGAKAVGKGIGGAFSWLGGKLGFSKDKNKKAEEVASVNPVAGNVMLVNGLLESIKKDNFVTDENGKPIVDADGKPIKKGGLIDAAKKGFGKLTKLFTSPITEIINGAQKGKKTTTVTVSTKSDPMAGVGGPMNEIMNNSGAPSYAAASNITTATTTVNNASTKSDPLATVNKTTTPATTTPATTTTSTTGTTTTQAVDPISEITDTSSQSGGNPLSKPFKITSPFGPRTLGGTSGNHYGVDLVPTDGSGQAEVGSRYSGVISDIKTNVPDSHTGLGVSSDATGNYVYIDTDDGLRIKNMHLKAGSIPSNLKIGSRINIGDKIGEMGTTGRSTGPHLHYQIEQSPYGKAAAVNPESYINGGSEISSFTTTSSSNYPATDGQATDNSSGSGPLAKLIEALGSIGKKFLNAVTGGLFGNDDMGDQQNSSTITYNQGSTVNSALVSAKYTNAQEFLKMVVKEIGVYENPANSNNVKYNTWFYGKQVSGEQYPWAMTFIQWCFDQAGLPIDHKTTGCPNLLNWYRNNNPEKVLKPSEGKPGDIAIYNFNHAGIIEKVTGGRYYSTIEGDTVGSDPNKGTGVHRKTRNIDVVIGIVRAVDFEELAVKAKEAAELAKNVKSGNIESLYTYLKAKGYTAEAISGILGCWTNESSNKPDTIEADFLYKNLDKDSLINNRDLMDDYTINKVWAKTKGVNKSAYSGSDGHLYPGIGYAQWTGPRGQALIDYAKSRNMNWSDSGLQLEFMDKELHDTSSRFGPNHMDLFNKMNQTTSPTEAVNLWGSKYEGIPVDDKRRSTAAEIYAKFKDNENTTSIEATDVGGIGGPDEESTIGVSTYVPKTVSTKSPSSTDISSSVAGSQSSYRSVNNYNSLDNSYRVTNDNITDLGAVTQLINEVIYELKSIVKYTGLSSDLLNDINSKEGTSQVHKSSYQSKSSVSRTMTATRSNTRGVTAIARPT